MTRSQSATDDGFSTACRRASCIFHVEAASSRAALRARPAQRRPPRPGSVERCARLSLQPLQDFLDIYYQGMSVLVTEQDFYDSPRPISSALGPRTSATSRSSRPAAHTARGIAFATVIDGLHRAAADAATRLGVEARLIMCFLRHLERGGRRADPPMRRCPTREVLGVGLDSSELGHPPSKFARVFRRARDAGLFLVAHAGEQGGAR